MVGTTWGERWLRGDAEATPSGKLCRSWGSPWSAGLPQGRYVGRFPAGQRRVRLAAGVRLAVVGDVAADRVAGVGGPGGDIGGWRRRRGGGRGGRRGRGRGGGRGRTPPATHPEGGAG